MKNPLDRTGDGRVNKDDYDSLDAKQKKYLVIAVVVIAAILLIAIKSCS